ncbi:MAG: methyltransferase domain-containing protein [Hyphomonadaceae bacterium]
MAAPPTTAPPDPMRIFDRNLHARRRARASAGYAHYSFLKKLAAEDIAWRLSAINRRFERVLDLGAHDGVLAKTLKADPQTANRLGESVSTDLSPAFGHQVADEEALPFAAQSFDLVVSALSLHWVNDLPGALIQIRRVLKPDGLFIATVLGGRTLVELRQSLLAAEEEIRGGATNRVSPMLDVIDAAGLLQRTQFAMPVADNDARTVRYAHPLKLLADLRGMGETAAFADRSAPKLTRGILMRAMEIYAQRFSDPDGRIRATFEFVTLSGWSPGPDQPKPKRPGSATARLADALGVKEQTAGEKAGGKT